MRGGGSNRIVGISVLAPHSQGFFHEIKHGSHKLLEALGFPVHPTVSNIPRYILRIPRWGNDFMLRHIATLNFVSTRLHAPVPSTAFHNLTSCEILLDLQDLSYDNCAFISTFDVTSSGCEMQSLAIPPEPDNDGTVHSLPVDGTSDTLAFIKTTCQRWKDYKSTFLRKPRAEWDRCSEMAQKMADRGFLNERVRFHFTHMDFFPRNILVDITNDSSVKVTGIIDWDDALFAPKYMACRAPTWLWEGEEELDEADEYGTLKEPKTAEMQENKALFETLVGADFLEYAYKEEYILLRRMFVILQIGLGYSHLWKELESIFDRWEELQRVYDAE